eukprot:c2536_g1_i1.p1 GENE.c2536_g1_i1~~c2536_g1_i1.p1  ORF type:complete len:490 (-),score=66.12 c2536_g1_i1:10-1479(-)
MGKIRDIIRNVTTFGWFVCTTISLGYVFALLRTEPFRGGSVLQAGFWLQVISGCLTLISLVLALGRGKSFSLFSCSSILSLFSALLTIVAALAISFKHAQVLETQNDACDPKCHNYFGSSEIASWIGSALALLSLVGWCLRSCAIVAAIPTASRPTLLPKVIDWPHIVPLLWGTSAIIPVVVCLAFISNRLIKDQLKSGQYESVIVMQSLNVVCNMLALVFGLVDLRNNRRQIFTLGCSLSGGSTLLAVTSCILIMNAGYKLRIKDDVNILPVCKDDDACMAMWRAMVASWVAGFLSLLSMCGWFCSVSYSAGRMAGQQGQPSFTRDKKLIAPFAVALLSILPAAVSLVYLCLDPELVRNERDVFVSGGSGWLVALLLVGMLLSACFTRAGLRELLRAPHHPLTPGTAFSIIAAGCYVVTSVAAWSGARHADRLENRDQSTCPACAQHAVYAYRWATTAAVLSISSLCGACCSRTYAIGDIRGRNEQYL